MQQSGDDKKEERKTEKVVIVSVTARSTRDWFKPMEITLPGSRSVCVHASETLTTFCRSLFAAFVALMVSQNFFYFCYITKEIKRLNNYPFEYK